ncbi:BZ3500_MvSof-1268-A1-R1_Chr8-2g10106 [Microbotryum saponariae]|uniref:BZ3500_MvSof-1268-A1-R1_Chr8-2g10106 protein n=1 Tax=Microbotryum saponariae TaxID=289078 RepID=A0A2X0KTK4_9BASI|nr:BZ3500_MvSof-1268-A1-R1_Chr8-2g10106 [Microbotryum saponariae]SDA01800.1 BZ3501_MvSof-1269-A2-R1_Chr8-2g09857 [Microbotryum saponariae]
MTVWALEVRFGNFGVKFSKTLPRLPMVQDQGSGCARFASFTKGGRPVERIRTHWRWTRS